MIKEFTPLQFAYFDNMLVIKVCRVLFLGGKVIVCELGT